MEKLKWHNETRKVRDLVPYDKNPRILTEKQTKHLKKSLEKFDLVEIPAIDIDNIIVAGHQRINILKLLGRLDEIIDVRVPNRKLTEKEFKEYNLRSNKNTGEWNYEEIFNSFDEELLKEVGFEEDELLKFQPDNSLNEAIYKEKFCITIELESELKQTELHDKLKEMGYDKIEVYSK